MEQLSAQLEKIFIRRETPAPSSAEQVSTQSTSSVWLKWEVLSARMHWFHQGTGQNSLLARK